MSHGVLTYGYIWCDFTESNAANQRVSGGLTWWFPLPWHEREKNERETITDLLLTTFVRTWWLKSSSLLWVTLFVAIPGAQKMMPRVVQMGALGNCRCIMVHCYTLLRWQLADAGIWWWLGPYRTCLTWGVTGPQNLNLVPKCPNLT